MVAEPGPESRPLILCPLLHAACQSWGLEVLGRRAQTVRTWLPSGLDKPETFYDPIRSDRRPSPISRRFRSGTLLTPHIPVSTYPAFAFSLQLCPLPSPADEILLHPTTFQLKSHTLWYSFQLQADFAALPLCAPSQPSPSTVSLLLNIELLTGRAGRFLQPLNPFRPFIAAHAPPSSTHQNCHEYWCCLMSSPHATASGMPCPVCHHCRGHRRCSVSSGCMDEGPQSQHVPGLAEVLSKHLPKR